MADLSLTTSRLTQEARQSEIDGYPLEAHELDAMARRLEEIHAARKARYDRATQLHDRECALYELTTGRDFDRWARTASVRELERKFGLA